MPGAASAPATATRRAVPARRWLFGHETPPSAVNIAATKVQAEKDNRTCNVSGAVLHRLSPSGRRLPQGIHHDGRTGWRVFASNFASLRGPLFHGSWVSLTRSRHLPSRPPTAASPKTAMKLAWGCGPDARDETAVLERRLAHPGSARVYAHGHRAGTGEHMATCPDGLVKPRHAASRRGLRKSAY
jgi:hypothetical protein